MREGDDEMAYLLLYRHAHLFLSCLSTHPRYKASDPAIQAVQQEVMKNLKGMELLKPRINRRYEEYIKAAQSRKQQRELDVRRRTDQLHLSENDSHIADDGLHAALSGQEHPDLAAHVAGQEFSKRGLSRRAYPTASSMSDEQELAAQMQAIRRRFEDQNGSPQTDLDQQRRAYIAHNVGFSYPSVPIQRPQSQQSYPTVRLRHPSEPLGAPAPPAKQVYEREARVSTLPPRPEKEAPVLPDKAMGEPESGYTFAPQACLEGGAPLRTIFLPPTLRTTFLRLAYKNTIKNLETCGFLCGTLRANALFVSTLVVPKQTATSDTCEMTDESELFDYVDQHDLMVLGWIHTHPTQTCFMSSRDLHTHSGYQMMLSESIAIVCAPSKGDTTHGGEYGIYRLTDPPGKMAVLRCDRPGIFHPHDVDDLYTTAITPGHVMEIPSMDFEIVDLRK